MTTYTDVLPARKSSKHSAINWTPAEGDTQVAGVLVIHTDRASVTYEVSEFATGWRGRGFVLRKVAGGTDGEHEAYDVFCSADGPEADSCCCKGATYTYSGTCKHKDAVRSLVGNSWL